VASSDIQGVPRIIDEDYLVREIEALKRQMRELGPSLMAAAGDAISTAVTFRHYTGGDTGFAVPTPITAAVFSATVDVPAGFTQVGVLATSYISAKNQSGGTSYIYARVAVGGDVSGNAASDPTGNGSFGTVTSSRANTLTGLTPGGTVSLTVLAAGSPGDWGTYALNAVFLNALLIFAR